jgi:hypothetical protein
MGKLKMDPWQAKEKNRRERELLVMAIGKAMVQHAFELSRDEHGEWELERMANKLPGMSLLRNLDALRAEAAKEQAAREPKPRVRKPAPPAAKKRPAKKRAKLGNGLGDWLPAKTAKTAKPAAAPRAKSAEAAEKVLEHLRCAGASLALGPIADVVPGARTAMKHLVSRGDVLATGKGKATRYSLPNGAGASKQPELGAEA